MTDDQQNVFTKFIPYAIWHGLDAIKDVNGQIVI